MLKKTTKSPLAGFLHEHLPRPIRRSKRFLLWRNEWNEKRQVLVKTPYYTYGSKRFGNLGGPQDLKRLTSLKDALQTYEDNLGEFDGIGLALVDEGIGAFDIDNCLDEAGELLPNHAGRWLVEQAERDGAYIEISPSLQGLRILGPCENPVAYSKNKLEYWGTERYVTLTGDLWANSKGWKDLTYLRNQLTPERDKPERREDEDDVLVTGKLVSELASALESMESDERELWIRMGHALKALGEKGFRLWDDWSRKSHKYNEDDAEATWDTLKPNKISYRSVFQEAQDNWGWDNPKTKRGSDDEEENRESDTLLDYALDISFSLRPTEFIVDGFMAVGLNMVSGGWGVGKTTNLLPLAASVAHLTPPAWGFHPQIRRKVLWVTEAPDQAMDVIYSITRQAGSADIQQWRDWFKIIPSVRESPKALAKQVQRTLPEMTYTTEMGFAVRPLVVLDTVSSNLDLENESDNSEVADAMSRIKETLRGAPLLLIGHTSKAAIAHGGIGAFRGASAWEADAEGTYFLGVDEETGERYMETGKVRFSPMFDEISFSLQEGRDLVETDWSEEPQSKGYSHGVPAQSSKDQRRQRADDAKNPQEDQETFENTPIITSLHQEIFRVVVMLEREGKFASLKQIERNLRDGQPMGKLKETLAYLVEHDQLIEIRDKELIEQRAEEIGAKRVPVRYYVLGDANAHA